MKLFSAIAVTFLLSVIQLSTVAQTYRPPAYTFGIIKYLQQYTIISPFVSKEKSYSGTFEYTVYVSKDGNVKFVNVLGDNPELRTEIKRVLRLSGKWEPALLNGVAIDTSFKDSVFICSIVGDKGNCNKFDSKRTIESHSYQVAVTGNYLSEQRDAHAHFAKAEAFFKEKQYRDAFIEFEAARELKYQPQSDAIYNLGACCIMMNETSKGCSYMQLAAQLGDVDAEKVYRQKCFGVATENINSPAPVEYEPVVTEGTNMPDSSGVYRVTETHPQFKDGDAQLIRFLNTHIMYPAMERDNDIQGTVMVRFIVNEDGSISDIKVTKGVSPGLDREAFRVIKALPKFEPGTQEGKAVKVYFNMPVTFKLQ